MPPGKNWALTQLGEGTTLELQVDITSTDALGRAITRTLKFDVPQFTSGWAVNDMPRAQCMLAIGRDVRELIKAETHRSASKLRQMRKARVIFRPRGEYDPDGTTWPREFKIFDGYFMGLAYNKINGKVQVIANLKHWLIDLACSSTVTNNSHPRNPAHLTARAVSIALDEEGASEGHYISSLAGVQLIRNDVVVDTWGAIKKLFCGLSNLNTVIGSSEEEGNCGGTGNAVKNDRARNALSRMEGPAAGNTFNCTKNYVYGVPLPLDLLNVQDAEDAVAKSIVEASIESYVNTTFWDKLVGEYCPAFSMAVVPAVDYALVIADTPAYRGNSWKTIEPGEYDSFSMEAELDRPLRAIGVIVQYGSFMGVPEAMTDQPISLPAVGGCHSENLEEPNDGVIHYVSAPSWLQCLVSHEPYARGTTGVGANVASRSATTPQANGGAVPPSTGTFVEDVNDLLNQYAQSIFVQSMLHGRVGAVSGKLRFDIAPGSVIKIKGSEEKFLAGEDELATSIVGCVSRLTIAINAEAGIAGTTFQLSHIRTEAENTENRTSVLRHPLFQGAIHGSGKHGAPLVVGHENLFTP